MGELVVEASTAKTVSGSVELLRDSFTRCRERLEAAAEKHRALAVMLVHQSELGNKAEPFWPENEENQGHYQLNLRGGPRCDIRQLLDANGQPAVGEKPYLDAEGQPMVYSNGEPIALYPGVRRTYSLYGKVFRGSDKFSYSEAIDEYNDAAAELGQLLDDLPEAARRVLWRDWPYGFVKPEPTEFWTHAVFELSWQELPASRLKADRWAWHKTTKLKCPDLPEWRDSNSPVRDMFAELIERVGDPPAFWYSWIDNIWRASIGAIDLLLTLLSYENPVSKTSSARQPAVVDTGGKELALDSPSAVFWETYPLKSYQEIYPDLPRGTFSSNPLVLQQLGNPPPYPTYTPDEDELAIVRTHYPNANPVDPPWKEIQAKLIAAGLSLDSLKELRSGDLVRVLAEKSGLQGMPGNGAETLPQAIPPEPSAVGGGEAGECELPAVDFIEQLERDTSKPFEIDEELSQIRIDGKSHNVSPEAVRMAKLLLDAGGDWVPMAKNYFTKPSETKQKLPVAVQKLIETAKGKGYRIKRNS